MLVILDRADRLELKWTVQDLINNIKLNNATFDNSVQRGIEWDAEKSSNLIRSILLNDFIPPFYVSKYGSTYSFIDGKQRTLAAIVPFVQNEYKLKGVDSIYLQDTETGSIEEYELNGKTFDDFPREIQDVITGRSLNIEVMSEPSEERECLVFYNLNNGKPLSAMTKTRVKSKSRKIIAAIGEHELFKNALTKKALEKYTNEDVVVKSWAMLNNERPSLLTKDIRELMCTIEITQEEQDQLVKCYDRVLEVHDLIEDKKVAKRIVTRTHMLSIIKTVWKSIENNTSAEDFMEWFVTLFAGRRSATINTTYNQYAGAGSARREAVAKRLEVVSNSYETYMTKLHEESAA